MTVLTTLRSRTETRNQECKARSEIIFQRQRSDNLSGGRWAQTTPTALVSCTAGISEDCYWRVILGARSHLDPIVPAAPCSAAQQQETAVLNWIQLASHSPWQLIPFYSHSLTVFPSFNCLVTPLVLSLFFFFLVLLQVATLSEVIDRGTQCAELEPDNSTESSDVSRNTIHDKSYLSERLMVLFAVVWDSTQGNLIISCRDDIFSFPVTG